MPVTQKPRTGAAKDIKKKESRESADQARQRKREAKRKGLKAGHRQAIAQEHSSKSGAANTAQDPRIGSRKPVALVVEAKAPRQPAKPSKTPEQIAAQQVAAERRQLEKELASIENDERLNLLLDRLDEEQTLAEEDHAWLDAKLERHQQLLEALGMDDDEDEEDAPLSSDDLLQRFIDDDFDPRELDPEYKGNKPTR